jgi:hypothetical protein
MLTLFHRTTLLAWSLLIRKKEKSFTGNCIVVVHRPTSQVKTHFCTTQHSAWIEFQNPPFLFLDTQRKSQRIPLLGSCDQVYIESQK